MTIRRAAGTTAALACLAVLTACSSDGDSSPFSSGANTSPTDANTSPTVASGSATVRPVTSDAPAPSGLTSRLLTPDEIGTGYTLSADQSSGTSALPCTPDASPLFTQAPPDEKANQNYQSATDDVEISEVVATYPDGAAATKAFQVGSAGFTCTSGTLSGTSVTIAERVKGVPAGSTLDDLGAWDFATGDIKGTSVLLRRGSTLVGLTFVAKPAAAAGVNVGAIPDKAAAKVG